MRKYWIIAIVAIVMAISCVIWEIVALVVSLVAIVFYTLIVGLFVFPSWESIDDVKKITEDDKRGF